MDSVLIISPALNEQENILQLLPSLEQLARSAQGEAYFDWILVIGAGDHQQPPRLVTPNLRVSYVRRFGSESFGSAIRTGLDQINPTTGVVIFMDADGSHDPSEIFQMLLEYRRGADVVIASRYVAGGSTDNSPILVSMSRLLNSVFRIALKLQVRDLSTNFKLFRSELLRDLKIEGENFEVVEELFIKAVANKELTVTEIPSHFRQRSNGKSKRQYSSYLVTFAKTLIRSRQGR